MSITHASAPHWEESVGAVANRIERRADGVGRAAPGTSTGPGRSLAKRTRVMTHSRSSLETREEAYTEKKANDPVPRAIFSFLSLKANFRLVDGIIPGRTMPSNQELGPGLETGGGSGGDRRLSTEGVTLLGTEPRGGPGGVAEAGSGDGGPVEGSAGAWPGAFWDLGSQGGGRGTGRVLREDYDRVHINVGASLEVSR